MKRVLVAGVLGGLLLLGTPTLASSAEKEERRTEKSDKGDGHDRRDRRDHDGKDRDHRGDRDRDRHRHHSGDRYYGGGYYGGPYHGGYYRDPYWDGYSGGPRDGQVIVQGQAFNPPEVHSRAGEPVLWLFQDGGMPHTVTADNGSFDSGQKVNDEYQLRFHHPGTYSYHCAIHPDMKGRVIIHG
jgi:hypothetical protein